MSKCHIQKKKKCLKLSNSLKNVLINFFKCQREAATCVSSYQKENYKMV